VKGVFLERPSNAKIDSMDVSSYFSMSYENLRVRYGWPEKFFSFTVVAFIFESKMSGVVVIGKVTESLFDNVTHRG
jgi:hypothetical protein